MPASPLGTHIERHHFVQRNRTMALLSAASVIIEAGDSSGTLSQGWEALRLGRPLFILQSVVENQRLAWPAEMQRYGAIVLTEPDSVLDVIPSSDQGVLSAAAFQGVVWRFLVVYAQAAIGERYSRSLRSALSS